jgi:hypothetical protein
VGKLREGTCNLYGNGLYDGGLHNIKPSGWGEKCQDEIDYPQYFACDFLNAYPSGPQEFARGQTVKSMRASGTTGPRMDSEALFSLLETVTMASGGMECATVMGGWIAKIFSFVGDLMQVRSPDMADSIQA